jgi:formylglycine-generating enzyme required for sulfatase activity
MRLAASILIALSALMGAASVAHDERVSIEAADFRPTLAPQPGADRVHIAAFRLDPRPVTNAQFLRFVLDHPEWQRGRVVSLFADEDYLSHWASPTELGHDALPQQPVTRISWFAARAYCAANKGRLPNWSEWELAAAADTKVADARNDPSWRARILDWYAKPASDPLSEVGMGPRNVYGVQDLHGLIWEWVEDFAALMVSGDSRIQGDPDKLAFCGAGALSAQDRDNYPILMRIAFLSSLDARSTAHSLGFRCAAWGKP